jgi:SOS response regulatory protein OraA/RecX
MSTVTALRPARPGHVLVELDGAGWRTIPLDVAARVGLAPGVELDRPRARTLRRELRRGEALTAGARALSHRDRSERGLRELLEGRGFAAPEREEAIVALRRAGAIDDGRFASLRAEALAERGLGDEAIASELERDGVDRERVRRALEELEPEAARVLAAVERRGATARTARWLARRGFAAESIEAAVPAIAGEPGTELGYDHDHIHELPASDSFEIGPET